MTLNAYIARSGICARRKAVFLIQEGFISVNGKREVNPAYRVNLADIVCYKEKTVRLSETYHYILLNKPAGYICSASDEKGRLTVVDLVSKYTRKRVYPVGRLDHDSTGLILLTNDGMVAHALTHPTFTITKIYQVRLDKPLLPIDAHKLRQGIQLSDGTVRADHVHIKNSMGTVVTISLHSGKNRIVRRMFSALGYTVRELDRIQFAGLRKEGMARGAYRHLTAYEVRQLKKLS